MTAAPARSRSRPTPDNQFMARALMLARRGLYTTDPNPRVGCVIVRDDTVVGEGWHERAGEAHAEIHALCRAGASARDADVYVTLEPCCHCGRTGPCTDALIEAGVRRVVFAMGDPNPLVSGQGARRLAAAGIAVETGPGAADAAALNAGFVRRMETGRPLVRLKLAASLDGRTAMASGQSRWISGDDARRDVHRWRARSSAVVTGIGTVLADDPRLTARLEVPVRQPLRVVVDSHLRTPPGSHLVVDGGSLLIFTARPEGIGDTAIEAAGGTATVIACPGRDGRVDLAAMIAELGARECNEVLVEAGPVLSGSFVAAGLVDELILYLAPSLLGDAGRGMFRLPGLDHLDDRVELRLVDQRMVGRDLRLIARVGAD